MTWNDRVRAAAYESPSGVRTEFPFEDVSKSVEKKTAAFDFPDAEGTYIQDLGPTGRRYPFRIFFWGDDHDLEADTFEASLLEIGVGKLEHPLYGTVDVVPFGEIAQKDNLTTAANQSVIEVTFWATTGLLYPTAQTDPAAAALASIIEFNATFSEEFGDAVATDPAGVLASLRSTYEAALGVATEGLSIYAEAESAVFSQFNAIADSITQGIDVLISDPLTLALQTVQLLQLPGQVLDSATARLGAYGDLASSIVGDTADEILGPVTDPIFGTGDSGGGAVPAEYGLDAKNANAFHVEDLYATAYVSGLAVSLINTPFLTKTVAIEAAEFVLQQGERVTAWQDVNYTSLADTAPVTEGASVVDTGGAYQQLQEVVALTAGYLVETSFSLKQERRITLTRNRTIIDLAAELYGSVDDQLDFLISSNALTGSEILTIPKGREIVYYV